MSIHSRPADPSAPTTKELLATGDGTFACPKCSTEFESMDALTDHVFGAHDPVREFALRWSGR